MIAARSCCPYSSASRLASVAHLMPSSLCPARTCAVDSANRYRGASPSRGCDSFCELGDGVVVASERDQHASQVESRQPERRLTLDGLPVFVGRRLELPLPLEDLSEIVVRLRVRLD